MEANHKYAVVEFKEGKDLEVDVVARCWIFREGEVRMLLNIFCLALQVAVFQSMALIVRYK